MMEKEQYFLTTYCGVGQINKKQSITLKQHGSLVRIPEHPPRKQFLLLEARTHLAWVEDENVQEHQPDEQALFFPSVKWKDRKV